MTGTLRYVGLQLLAAVGAFNVSAMVLNVADIFYLSALRPSRLQRYQHGHKDSRGPANPQDANAWALVTGSSDGIGYAFAAELARNGFNVALHGRNEDKLERKMRQLQSEYPGIAFRKIVADASNSHGLRQRITSIGAEMVSLPGPLTVLVNNVGAMPTTSGGDMVIFAEQSSADIDITINVNVRFTTQLTRGLLPLLQHNGPSLVIIIGSGGADLSPPYLSMYVASKGFQKIWTQSVAAEMELEGQDQDVEVLGINTGVVADAGGNDYAASMFVPTAATYARSALRRVGCGRSWVWGHWAHAMQGLLLSLLPAWLMHKLILKKVKAIKEDRARKR